jgi:hypothetical protein
MNQLFPGMTGVTFRNIERDGTILREWPAPKLNMKTKVVCATCNNGWMSAMERDSAKPAMADLILGNPVGELSKKRAHGLSLFAFKTAVIANRSLPESAFFFTALQRHAFRRSRTIPGDVAMFLVGMENVKGGGIGSFNVFYPDRDRPNLSLNVCSFWVGQLGFQVVSAKSVRAQKIESLPTPADLTVSFYPDLAPQIRWPRKRVLSMQAFNDFSNRWNAIRRA